MLGSEVRGGGNFGAEWDVPRMGTGVARNATGVGMPPGLMFPFTGTGTEVSTTNAVQGVTASGSADATGSVSINDALQRMAESMTAVTAALADQPAPTGALALGPDPQLPAWDGHASTLHGWINDVDRIRSIRGLRDNQIIGWARLKLGNYLFGYPKREAIRCQLDKLAKDRTSFLLGQRTWQYRAVRHACRNCSSSSRNDWHCHQFQVWTT